jgi:hypothetical protein
MTGQFLTHGRLALVRHGLRRAGLEHRDAREGPCRRRIDCRSGKRAFCLRPVRLPFSAARPRARVISWGPPKTLSPKAV